MGLVCALDKCNGRTDASAFCPWAGVRARQVTQFLASRLPVETYGFLPGRDATEVWFLLETMIESALQTGVGLSGHSCDLIKAFSIRRTVGPAIRSTSEFPEGCPLSLAAMLIVNVTFHVYMGALCPQVRHVSYADDLSGNGAQAWGTIQSAFVKHGLWNWTLAKLSPGPRVPRRESCWLPLASKLWIRPESWVGFWHLARLLATRPWLSVSLICSPPSTNCPAPRALSP